MTQTWKIRLLTNNQTDHLRMILVVPPSGPSSKLESGFFFAVYVLSYKEFDLVFGE